MGDIQVGGLRSWTTAAILISVLISRFQEMRGAMIEKHRGLWTITGLKARVTTLDIENAKVDARQDGSDELEYLPEKEEETVNKGVEEMETIEEVYEDEGLLIQEENFVPTVERDTVLTTSKPESTPSADPAANTAFEFRKLLWHEPPNLDYASIYELTDAVQQEIKDIGGADLEWRTNRLVLVVERNLLFDYQLWVQHQWRPKYLNKDSKPLSETGQRFYINLEQILAIEARQVSKDSMQNDERYEKALEDVTEFVEIVDRVKTRAEKRVDISQHYSAN